MFAEGPKASMSEIICVFSSFALDALTCKSIAISGILGGFWIRKHCVLAIWRTASSVDALH